MLTIVEFAKERNVNRDTVNAYIRQHPEIQKETRMVGKNMVIDTDSEAYRLLDKKYPLPQLIQVIEDTESQKKLIKAQEVIIQLQSRINEQAAKIAHAEAIQMLLDDKEMQLNRANEQIQELKDMNDRLTEQLDTEKSKTWIQKLFKK